MRTNGVAAGKPRKWRLPKFTGNTPTYNDEGTAATGWTTTNGALTQPTGSTVRLAASAAGTMGLSLRSVTMPVPNKDWCLYAKITARATSGDTQILQIRGTGTERASIYFNYNTVTALSALGQVSLRHTNAAGTSNNSAGVTGLSTTAGIDILLRYDSKFSSLSISLRQTDGTWSLASQIAGTFFGTQLALSANNSSVSGAWIEWDFLTLVSPDIVSIGDSITKGETLYSPTPSDGLGNSLSTYQRHAAVYTTHRNNFIVNKGVGGNTSAMVASRIQADVMDNLAKVVLLGACNNDYGASISRATRKTNIQNSINTIAGGGGKCVLINAVYSTSTNPNNPGSRTYYEDSWREDLHTLTGVSGFINPMQALKDAAGYQDPAYTQADGIHPNPTGYARYGKYVSGLNP